MGFEWSFEWGFGLGFEWGFERGFDLVLTSALCWALCGGLSGDDFEIHHKIYAMKLSGPCELPFGQLNSGHLTKTHEDVL